MLIAISESRGLHRNSVRYPVNAGEEVLGGNPMQSFSTCVRRIAIGFLLVVGAIFSGVVFPVVAHFIQEQPQETANVKEPWHEM
jgi:hypothetical protein